MAKTPRKATRRKKPATAKPAAISKAIAELRKDHVFLVGVVGMYGDKADRLDTDLAALTARVRELDRRLAAVESPQVYHAVTFHPPTPDVLVADKLPFVADGLPDPLAGCVVVDTAIEPWRLDASGWCYWDGKRYDEFPTEPTPYAPTHPAPCRETGTLRPIIVGSWWHRRRSTDLTTSPLPGDASCLLGEDGVSIRNGVYSWIMPYVNTWMIGELDENGNDRYPDFTIPRSTTWTP